MHSSRSAHIFLILLCLICTAKRLDAQQVPSDPIKPTPQPKHSDIHPRETTKPPPARMDMPGMQEGGMRHEQQPGIPPPYYNYPFGSSTNQHRVLTVDQSVEMALGNASAYQQSRLDERVAVEDVRQARKAFLPQFSLPLIYNGTTNSLIREPDEPIIYSFVASSAINETSAFLNASGAIDLSGRLRASLRRSRALLAAAHSGALVARRSLIITTVDAYYGLVLARQKRRLADETLALAEAFAKIAENSQQNGEEQEADVLRARGSALLRRDELEQARAAESAALDLLRVLTGVEFSTHIDLSNVTDSVPTANDFSDYTEALIQSRPELNQIDSLKSAALADASEARRELLPELTYSLNGGFDAADFRPLGRYSGGQAIVGLNIPLFNWGVSKSREAQARLRAQSLDLQRENTLRELRAEFYTSRANALSAIKRIGQTRAAADALQRNITLVFSRYRAKQSTILDVLDAQSSYAAARLAFYQSIADYRTAHVRLEADPAKLTDSERTQPRAPDVMPAPPCSLTLSRAPDVGGFRLGMNTAQARALARGLKVSSADELGVASAMLSGNALNYSLESRGYFEGVESVALEFTDGRLSFIRINYPLTNRWGDPDEFVNTVAQRLNLRGKWKRFYDWDNKNVRDTKDLNDLALECGDLRISAGIGVVGLGGDQIPHIEFQDMTATTLLKSREDEKTRREIEDQKRKDKP